LLKQLLVRANEFSRLPPKPTIWRIQQLTQRKPPRT
jgi:hypothetical protein